LWDKLVGSSTGCSSTFPNRSAVPRSLASCAYSSYHRSVADTGLGWRDQVHAQHRLSPRRLRLRSVFVHQLAPTNLLRRRLRAVAVILLATIAVASTFAVQPSLNPTGPPRAHSTAPATLSIVATERIDQALAAMPTDLTHSSEGTHLCSKLGPSVAVCAGTAAPAPATLPPGSKWWNITSHSSARPAARWADGMVYDAADGYVLMFGGGNRTAGFADTWKFAGGVWSPLMPPSSPSARSWPGLVYDAKDGYVLLFGGVEGGIPHSDTWKFSQGVWTELYPAIAPPARWFPGIAYDVADSTVVLFGGGNSSGMLGDTWTFMGGSWTQKHPATSPNPRWASSMAYDGRDAYVVLFSGINASYCFGDTWTYAAGVWTLVTAATFPQCREGGAFAYDPAGGELVLSGGINLTGANDLPDSWSFSGGGWTRLVLSNPPARSMATEVWDGADGYLLLFDGFNDSYAVNRPTDSQWALTAPLQAGVSASPNPTDVGSTVQLSPNVTGGVGPETFSWTFGDGGSSLLLSPTHTYAQVGARTVNLTAVDSFGISSTSSLIVNVNPPVTVRASVAPTPLDAAQMTAFDAQASGGTPPFGFLWAFGDGAVGATANASHAYATPGNFAATVNATDAAGAVAVLAVHVLVNPLPTVALTSSVHSPNTGQSITLNAIVTGGTGSDTFLWNLGDGSTASGSVANHSYASKGTYEVQVTVSDRAGGSSIGRLNITVSSPATPGLLGLSGSLGYVVAGVVVAAVVAIAAIVVARRGGGGGTASHPPPSGTSGLPPGAHERPPAGKVP
jgi:PKD repeat protein